jgi:hypothetical protein
MKISVVAKRIHFTTFPSDSADNVMLEIYCNQKDEVPDYPNMSPLIVSLAFSDDNPEATKTRITAAGETALSNKIDKERKANECIHSLCE